MLEAPHKSTLNQLDRSSPHKHHAIIKSQLSKAKLAPLSISPNRSKERHQVMDSPAKRAVSKLSIDLRDVHDQYPAQVKDPDP